MSHLRNAEVDLNPGTVAQAKPRHVVGDKAPPAPSGAAGNEEEEAEDTNIEALIIQIQSMNKIIKNSTDDTRERVQSDRDNAVEKLFKLSKSHWCSKIRLTLMDDARYYHNEDIKFTSITGETVNADDLFTMSHIIVVHIYIYLLGSDQKGSKKDQIVRRPRNIDIQLRQR